MVAPTSKPVQLYVFDCGQLDLEDISAFGLTNDDSPVRTLFVPCYLIDHPNGKLFWDGGLPTGIAGQGDIRDSNGTVMRYKRSVIDQLADLDLSPEDIDFVAFSHLHFDHVGAANQFTRSHLLIQRPEFDAAFEHAGDYPVFDPALYANLKHNPRTILDGDHDVFGDASVRILSAPGHTPGHQMLFVDLATTGPVVLSGDLYHFRESIALKATPIFNTSREQTLASMARIQTLLDTTRAVLWIEHEQALADSLNMAPYFYD